MGASVAVAFLGFWIAYRIYGGNRGLEGGKSWAMRFQGPHRWLENKYFVDELYERIVIRPLAWLSRMLWKVVDGIVIEGSLHVGAFLTELSGDLTRLTTTGNVRNYALYFFLGLVALFWWILL